MMDHADATDRHQRPSSGVRVLRHVKIDDQYSEVRSAPGGPSGFILSETKPCTEGFSETVQYHADQINSRWRETVDGVLATTLECAKADAALTPAQKRDLCARIPFKRRTFNKLSSIGRNGHYQQSNIRDFLPAHWTMLAIMAKWSLDDFQAAIDENVLTPQVSRKTLLAFDQVRRDSKVRQVAARATDNILSHPVRGQVRQDVLSVVSHADVMKTDDDPYQRFANSWHASELKTIWDRCSSTEQSNLLVNVMNWKQ